MRLFALLTHFLALIALSWGRNLARQIPTPSRVPDGPTPTEGHGLGLLDPSPTSDSKLDKINRKTHFKSYDSPPISRPGTKSPWVWVDDPSYDSELPPAIDWRDHFGINWITTVQDQGYCGSCWAYTTTGLIESMIRIQHGAWSKRSEADLFEASPVTCGSGYQNGWALKIIETNQFGLSDIKCNIHLDSERPFYACGDREGRTLRIGDYVTIEGRDDAKWWLANIGPITCQLQVYTDFLEWKPENGVYRHNPSSKHRGGHGLLIVGYDDERECWILKNSWGTGFGDKGYIYVGYGEVTIDDVDSPKYGVTNIDPDQFARRFHHNGNLYQSAGGKTHRDFEVIRASADGNLLRVKRTGEGEKKWSVEEQIFVHGPKSPSEKKSNFHSSSPAPASGHPIMLETSFSRQREIVYWDEQHGTFAHWMHDDNPREGRGKKVWHQAAPGAIPGSPDYGGEYGIAAGFPGFVQLDDSTFSVVVRTNDGCLTEYHRDLTRNIWYPCLPPITTRALQSGPALVQSNIDLDVYNATSVGNLYVVTVLSSGSLGLFWRTATGPWLAGEVFASHIPDTPPVMIQDFFDTRDERDHGGFQLLVAAEDGWVEHWQRRNGDILKRPPMKGVQGRWERVGRFGDGDVMNVWGLVQGSFNFALEAVVEDFEGRLWHWEFDGAWKKMDMIPEK